MNRVLTFCLSNKHFFALCNHVLIPAPSPTRVPPVTMQLPTSRVPSTTPWSSSPPPSTTRSPAELPTESSMLLPMLSPTSLVFLEARITDCQPTKYYIHAAFDQKK